MTTTTNLPDIVSMVATSTKPLSPVKIKDQPVPVEQEKTISNVPESETKFLQSTCFPVPASTPESEKEKLVAFALKTDEKKATKYCIGI